jgi:hypothetical protein
MSMSQTLRNARLHVRRIDEPRDSPSEIRYSSLTAENARVRASKIRKHHVKDWETWMLDKMAFLVGDQSNQMAWCHNYGDEGFYKSSNNLGTAFRYANEFSARYMKKGPWAYQKRLFNIADHTFVSGAELSFLLARICLWAREERPETIEDLDDIDDYVKDEKKKKFFDLIEPLPFPPGTALFGEEFNVAFAEAGAYASRTPEKLLKLFRSYRPVFFTNSQTFALGALANMLFHHVHFRVEMKRKVEDLSAPVCELMVRVRKQDLKWFVCPSKVRFLGGKFIMPEGMNPDNYNYGEEYVGSICPNDHWAEYGRTKGQHQVRAVFAGLEEILDTENKRGHGMLSSVIRKSMMKKTDGDGTQGSDTDKPPKPSKPKTESRRSGSHENVVKMIAEDAKRTGRPIPPEALPHVKPED